MVDSYTARCQIAHHPFCITIPVFLEGEHGLVCVTESKVESLGGEISDDIGSITPP